MGVFKNMADNKMILNDSRTNLRVKDNTKIAWSIDGINGKGKVRNISTSGMLLETDTIFDPKEHRVLSFDSVVGENDFIPKTGRVVWQKKKNFSRNGSICGIQFVDTDETVLSKLRQRVQMGIIQFTKEKRIKNIFELAFLAVSVFLICYVIYVSVVIYQNMTKANDNMSDSTVGQAFLVRDYSHKYTDAKTRLTAVQKAYEESQTMLENVTNDLNATKLTLAQTEEMLSKTKAELAGMNTEFARSKSKFENKIKILQEKSIEMENEIVQLTKKISYYEGNVADIKEGKALLNLYKDKMKLVKNKIHSFQIEAREIRISAMKERDRIRSILGNNGYFVKGGQAVKVDMEKYESATVESIQSGQKFEVDVSFFE